MDAFKSVKILLHTFSYLYQVLLESKMQFKLILIDLRYMYKTFK